MTKKYNNLKLLKKKLPKDFHEAVSFLTGPYTPISTERYKSLVKILIKNKCDIFTTETGELVTVGQSGSEYSIMPIQKKRYSDLLSCL